MIDFIKKYLVYGIYILVILVSIGIYVWAILITGNNVKEYSAIETQYRTATTLGTKAVPENVIQFYNENIKLAEEDKKNVLDFCKTTSSRPFLFINVFPFAPQDVSKQYYTNFASEYCKAVENYLTILRASDKPTALEEQNYLANSKRTSTDAGAGAGAVGRDPRAGGGGAMMATGSADEKLLNEFREQRSQQISIYANLDSFVLYEFWQNHDGSTGTTTSLQTDSWYSQIAHWIQEDVALSINKINSLTSPVTQNPVKRLVEISFSGSAASSGTGTGAGAGGGRGGIRGGAFTDPRAGGGRTTMSSSNIDVASRSGSTTVLPGLVVNAEDATGTTLTRVSSEMAKPWTGNYSNEITDVFHFSTSVIISSNRINDFINSLQSSRTNADGTNSRNQITVLQYNLSPVNIQTEENNGYYYGGGSLVRADFICQYVFFKSGYESKIPNVLKTTTTVAGM